ncbi:MAG: YdeI/OmpD-associated family protein [Pseudomonadota bacterium]
MAKTVEAYIAEKTQWSDEISTLRDIILTVGFEESVKWGMPSYHAHGQLLVGIGAFKNHFCLWFHQGALLKDKDNVLMNAQEGKTKAMRQWRMNDAKDIKPRRLRQYLKEVKALAAKGEKVPIKKRKAIRIPIELKAALAKDAKAEAAFKALSATYRREYAEYIIEAKRPETKERRVKKILPMIKNGAGLNDAYR